MFNPLKYFRCSCSCNSRLKMVYDPKPISIYPTNNSIELLHVYYNGKVRPETSAEGGESEANATESERSKRTPTLIARAKRVCACAYKFSAMGLKFPCWLAAVSLNVKPLT